jgi:glycerol-3-phosphate acyltransferase PlsY
MELILVCFYSYIAGSIPFGLIITKLFLDKDITKIGSGNIGATNVLRTGKKYLAVITLMLDISKGFFSVLITQIFFSEYVLISALLVFLGHIFSVWLKFKGGKGVATYLGILIALSYELSILFIATWLVVLLIFKYSSVSSLFSSLTLFVITFVRETAQSVNNKFESSANLSLILFIFLIIIIFTHQKNIKNLKNKIEPKIKL